jgi:hypothetical protein
VSIGIVNCKDETKVNSDRDVTWHKLIEDSEYEIEACKDKISKLRKSIDFFKKQSSLGIDFPRLQNKT